MLNRRIVLSLGLSASLLTLAHPTSAQEAKLDVVTSFSILGDLAKEVGGEHVAVTTFVGPDGDAHVYEPTPADARALASADVLISNGLQFEPWLARLVETSGFNGKSVVATEGVVTLESSDADEHDEESAEDENAGARDPHAWQSLSNGVIYVRNIEAAFVEADPENAADYKANADAYVTELEALDARIKSQLGALPEGSRKVVTSHDAFGYFVAAYGLDFVAPEGLSTEAEASADDVARIIDQIRAEGIKAVFVENITDTRLIEQIAMETGAKVGGSLYSDALSPADGQAPTYVKMFEHNVAEIVGALSPQ